MQRTFLVVVLIFAIVSFGWLFLGAVVTERTQSAEQQLLAAVGELWGSPLEQASPTVVLHEIPPPEPELAEAASEELDPLRHSRSGHGKKDEDKRTSRLTDIDGSDIDVRLALEPRRKGLLWYATYVVDFEADYVYRHDEEEPADVTLQFRLPLPKASYDGFVFTLDGEETEPLPRIDSSGTVKRARRLQPGETIRAHVAYRTRGLDSWTYTPTPAWSRQARDFSLHVVTNFDAIDFPEGSLSPTTKAETSDGWELDWSFESLISGFRLGVQMPKRLNPGPLAARIVFFAPVCLGFFFAWLLVITLMRGVTLHGMHYLFLAAAFFAFHLLLSHLVDHLSLPLSFCLASAASVGLVVSYLRIVVGPRFALVEAGLAQLVYLVFFSFAHFFEGLTGLTVTIGSVLTLLALMQLTARIDWSEVFGKKPSPTMPPPAGSAPPATVPPRPAS